MRSTNSRLLLYTFLKKTEKLRPSLTFHADLTLVDADAAEVDLVGPSSCRLADRVLERTSCNDRQSALDVS